MLVTTRFYQGNSNSPDTGLTLSDEASVELLESKIASMESLTESLESTATEWQIRSAMQKHTLLMMESVEISEQLFYSDLESIDLKERGGASSTPVDNQDDEIVIEELQLRTLSTLMRHVVIRQNIMMERMVLFK
jgi:hypothetical protein